MFNQMLAGLQMPMSDADIEAALSKCQESARQEFAVRVRGMDADEALLRLEKELGKLESAFKAMNAERFESDFRSYSDACFTEIKTAL